MSLPSNVKQNVTGIPYLDYGARFYHPLSSRWTTMDPMAEKYYSVSPYAFCLENPVTFAIEREQKELVHSAEREQMKALQGVTLYHIFTPNDKRYHAYDYYTTDTISPVIFSVKRNKKR